MRQSFSFSFFSSVHVIMERFGILFAHGAGGIRSCSLRLAVLTAGHCNHGDLLFCIGSRTDERGNVQERNGRRVEVMEGGMWRKKEGRNYTGKE